MEGLEGAQEVDQVLLLLLGQRVEIRDDLVGLRANLPCGTGSGMGLNRSYQALSAAVMHKEDALAYTPQRRGAKFVCGGFTLADAVVESGAHVMQRKIGEGLERGIVQRCQVGPAGSQAVGVAQYAADPGIGSGPSRGRHHGAEKGLAAES